MCRHHAAALHPGQVQHSHSAMSNVLCNRHTKSAPCGGCICCWKFTVMTGSCISTGPAAKQLQLGVKPTATQTPVHHFRTCHQLLAWFLIGQSKLHHINITADDTPPLLEALLLKRVCSPETGPV
jgi:hypothetical protein